MTPKQARVYNLLSGGNSYTVIEISVKAHIGDPRSIIRDLRNMGIIVRDEWVETRESRFKRYWIEPETANKTML